MLRFLKVLPGLLCAALLVSGCAVLSQEDRVLTRTLDEKFTPRSGVAKIAAAPVALPVGVAALAIDGVLLNPVRNLSDSAELANIVFEEVPFTGLGEVIVFPMRLITYPILFLGAELVLCTIPVNGVD